MKALTIYESLNQTQEFKTISIENSSIHQYFDSMFAFLIREFPPEDASEFLEEYEEDVIYFYRQGLIVFDAAIKLRQSYENFIHRYDTITETQNFTRGLEPKAAMSIGQVSQIHKWFSDLGIERSRYSIDDKLNITVKGDLYLSNTKITRLPDNLTVNGGLYLRNTKITSLPDNLTVNGGLDLSNTNITSLPDNLTVKGNLYLSNTNITSLPDSLKVKGKIYKDF
ncbi:MAG: hypothetical protein WC554_13965 [Clostridia bacterium]